MSSLLQDIRYLAHARGTGFSWLRSRRGRCHRRATHCSLIKGAYFEGLPYPQPREILTIDNENVRSGQKEVPLSGPEFVALAEQSRTLSHPTALIGVSVNVTGEGDAVRFRALRASANFFAMVGVQPLLGRVFAAEEQRPGQERVVVVSYDFWQRALGGTPDVTAGGAVE